MGGWLYRFARTLFNQTLRLYYRRVEVTGRDHVPPAGPVILVVNHPNSVADACLVATRITERPVGFIAKDTLTRAPVLGWLARSIGVIGVARPVEYGKHSDLARERNRLAIESCVPRLLAGELIAIFAEGISTDARRLHTLRKGAMRFGYAAERAAGFGLGVAWVPVGISYSAKQRFRSDVLVRIGTPLRLAEVRAASGEDEDALIERGTERLQSALEDLVVSIEGEDLAGLVDRAAGLLGNPDAPIEARVERLKRVARALEFFNVEAPHRVTGLREAIRRHDERLRAMSLTDDVVRQRHPAAVLWRSVGALVGHGALLLLNGYGWINSLAPRWISWLLGRLAGRVEGSGRGDGGVRSPLVQQAAWATYGGWAGAAVAFPIQTALVYLWAAGARGWIAGGAVSAVYALTLVPSWRLYVERRDLFEKHLARARDALRFLLHARHAVRLRGDRDRIVLRLRDLLRDYESKAASSPVARVSPPGRN